MRLSVLGSGSGGNCTYVATERTRVLVDLGFGRRSLERRFQQAELPFERINGVLLTHGHSDHVSGVLPFVTKQRVPVFMNEGTREEVAAFRSIERWERFETGSSFVVGDLWVEAFSVPHDANQPVGFRFSAGGVCGALVTDLGELSESVVQKLSGCDWLVLESNHDEEMVKIGPYPWVVKQRLLSNLGHLSNRALCHFLSRHFDGRASHIFLAHLSRQNNDPAIARHYALSSLAQRLTGMEGSKPPCGLHLTHQRKPSIVITL